MTTSSRITNPVQKHRREVWLRIVAPVALAFAVLVVGCVLLAIGVATGMVVNKQVSVVMGVVATLFISFPLALLCLVPYLALAMLARGTGELHARATGPLRGTRRLTTRIAQGTKQHVPKLGRPLIGLNARLTRWEHVIKNLQAPAAEESTDD